MPSWRGAEAERKSKRRRREEEEKRRGGEEKRRRSEEKRKMAVPAIQARRAVPKGRLMVT
jgi:hypothetical protein